MIDRVEVDETDLTRLVAALNAEADGKRLGEDLARDLADVLEPAVSAAKAAVMGMSSSSDITPVLRSAVASGVQSVVRTTGSHPGVAIIASKDGMPRSFRNAPKRLNARKGWRHRVYGQNVWVSQVGQPGWFDDTIPAFKPAAERAAAKALDAVARRIDSRTKG